MDRNDEVVVGIDLGTTNSAVALFSNEQIRVLDNSEGDRITPSFVLFVNENISIVGLYAKRMAARNKPEYGIYAIKRLIGRKYDDNKVQEAIKHLLYTIEEESNQPIIVINQPKETLRKTPIEICSTILLKIKEDVETKIGKKKNLKAVITVPAHFSLQQREATLEAAKNADFHVLKLLNEPTAAAYRYIFENKNQIQNNDLFLVYDFGGGTFDVAILRKTAENVETIAVDGDSFLGGHDLDNIILIHVCDVLREKYKLKSDFDKTILRRLRNECEDVKKRLSYFEECEIILEGIVPEVDVSEIKITRNEFELMAIDLFRKTIDIVDNCLKSNDISKHNIKKVVLCGGSTRIPKIQKLLTSYFGKEVLSQFLHPDECVAEGAAIQAAILSKHPEQTISMIKVVDVTPLSIGVGVYANQMHVVIKRATQIPCSKTLSCFTVYNKQTSCLFNIYEGERTDCRKNRHLGQLLLENLTPAPPRQCEMLITMTIDENGILTILSKEHFKNNTKELKVAYTKGLMSDAEVENSLKDAVENAVEDEMFLNFANKKQYLINYCQSIIYNIETQNLIGKYTEVYTFCTLSDGIINKIEMNDNNKLIERINETKLKCENLVQMYNFRLMPMPF